ncbi:MAG: cytochrome C554 [Candidatus Aminicenantes bacterium]|nr:cytochrome C554 [Candidatus Aminicenantes bacterium]NIM80329.1 cytochrome C554 [Candidatus Aminicenantes bacterium]NIN16820.1 cytochrome C554 [Candidatus Aminicenantes bacterium]NIN40676.1 cytochrome C554 [Candidatus Aminicenantes bacterium]NIN83499.1 cytochrome C554 [Candidatus Aminicenantes bacterium]
MKRVILVTVCVLVALSLVYAGDFTYIGAKKCKMCHKGPKKGEVYEKWEKGSHAKAFETLKAKGEEKNPKCLECHVTGFNAGGYKVGDANAAKFEGVGCESCHGPGSEYKKMSIMKDLNKSKENGLIIPDEAVCKKCHNEKSPTFKGFDFAKYAKKIDHKYTKK